MKLPNRSVAWILLAGAASAAGCAAKSETAALRPAVRGISSEDAASLNAGRSRFDGKEDQPFNARTHFAAGQLAESQNAPAAAIEQYGAALKIDPKHLPSLYRVGVLHAQLQQYPQAVAAWKRYVEITGGDATGYANLGFCHELASQPSDAEAAYERGIAKDPKSNPCRVNYGLMLARAGRTNEAIVQLQAVLPEAQVRYNLASAHELMGRRGEAVAEYRKAMQLDPNLLEAKTRLAALE